MAKQPDTKETKPAKPVLGEVAAAGGGIDGAMTGYVNEIASSGDSVLNSLGGDLTQYEKLLSDDRVHTTFQQRRRAVTSTEWDVEPGGDSPADKAAAEDAKEQLEAIKFDRITDKMLYGLHYGYAVGECMWRLDGNRVVLDDIKVRKAKRFRFGTDGTLRLLRQGHPKGIAMPERKFWTFTAGADNDDELYGKGLGHWLYWPVFLKRNSVRFWAIVLEKFGMPTALGKYGASATEKDIKKLLEALQAISSESAVAIPEGMAAELLEATRRSGGDHNVFYREMNSAITSVVLSQTMTTENGSSRSQAEVHMDVRQDVIIGDADLQCESFNDGPLTWLTEWNHPGAKPPRVWRNTDEPEDLQAASERDKTLYDMGWEAEEERILKTYGPGYTRRATSTDTTKPQDGNPAFAEGDVQPDAPQDAIEAFFADLAQSGDIDEAFAPLLEPIQQQLERAESFEEMQTVLEAALTEDTVDAFGELLAKALFQARMAGEADAPLDDGGNGGTNGA
jgi:phage gp29-like protein